MTTANGYQIVRTSHGDYLEQPVSGLFKFIGIPPRIARRCNITMGISGAVAVVMRIGIMLAAPALGASSMTLDQKAAVVISASISGIFGVATFLIAFCVRDGQSVKTATIKVAVMFILLGFTVYYSYQPVMNLFMYVLAHTQH